MELEKISAALQKELNTNGIKSTATQAQEAEIGKVYLKLIDEIVFLKEKLAALTKTKADLSEIEKYRKIEAFFSGSTLYCN